MNNFIIILISYYIFQAFCLFVAASAASLEDAPEVAAAKQDFLAAFKAASAGEHAALAPVNNDVQAEQIPSFFLEDTEDVAVAKAAFLAAFEDASAGGLAAKQAPAPTHTVAQYISPGSVPMGYQYMPTYQNYPSSYYSAYPYAGHHFGYPTGYPTSYPYRVPYSNYGQFLI